MVAAALNQQNLQQAAISNAGVCAVTAPRSEASPIKSQPGVVHLGLGGFHRAHQAMVFDELIAKGDHRWRICSVGMRSDKLVRQMRAQDHLYLVRVSDTQGSRWHAPEAIVQTWVAANEPDAVIQQIASPHTRWLTLTVTEKAYTPELANLIVRGLARRHTDRLPGLTIASCDNLPQNGRVLRALCVQSAGSPEFAPALSAWIETECRFPCSMVDRIVPAPSPEIRQAALEDLGLDDPTALGVEAFWEWVIEDALVDPSDADALRSVGVVVTSDVSGFEQAKLWMLNGSHSVLASIGVVLGDQYIREVIARPVIRDFVHGLMTHASGPLVGRPNWQAYRDALIERFGNTRLDHACLQVYADSSQKIPVRWVPVAEALLARRKDQALGSGLSHLAMAVAIFARSLSGLTENGRRFDFHDPLAADLQALARDKVRPDELIGALLNQPDARLAIFGKMLGQHAAFAHAASQWLVRIHAEGVQEAVSGFLQENSA